MPIGGFLDSFPTALFVSAHILFLLIGLWAWKMASAAKQKFAPAFWLYVASQIVFLGFFGNVITMKMAVLTEQTLMVVMVYWIASRKPA